MVTECTPMQERQSLLAASAAPGHGPGPLRREDPMSHRIIEKRRRDRMNNCLADLSRLIPAEYLKKGRGRVEKTEIIEMAIKHMQYLQSRAECSVSELHVTKCESERDQTSAFETVCPCPPLSEDAVMRPVVRPIVTEHYRLGYQECLSEAMHFLVEVEGFFVGDSLCVKLISHLQKHCDRIVKGDRLNFPRSRQPGEASSSSGSSSSCQGGGSKAPITSASWLGNEDPPPSSQLRDMLCASPPGLTPHLGYLPPHTPPPPQQPLYEEIPRHHHLDLPQDVHPDHLLQHHHSYKFKNTIKQRFSEEHSNSATPPPAHSVKRRRVMATRSPSPAMSQPASSSQHTGVPIFVLHTKGAFYIPLTVSYEVLAPYLETDFLTDVMSSTGGPTTASSITAPSVVLHPVTISVNFQQYLKAPPPQTPAPQPLPSAIPSQHSWPHTEMRGAYPPHPWDQ